MSDPSAAIGPIILWVVLGAALYVWTSASLHAVFRKAGEEGWKGWVPILNTVTLLRLGRVSGWWVLLLLFPPAAIVLWVLLIVAYRRINASFGLGVGMTVLAALLPPVWSSIVGWGSAQWVGDDRSGPAPGPVRTPSGQLDARFGSSFAMADAAARPSPVVAAVPLASPPVESVAHSAAPVPRSAPPVPTAAETAADPAPESAALSVVAAVGARDAAGAGFFADDTIGSAAPRSPFVPASASAASGRPDSPASPPSPPMPPPPTTAAAASNRSPMRGIPGPVTTTDPAPPSDPDRPGPMRSRGGAYGGGYDIDDDADVVDDPLVPVDPYRPAAVADVSEETPPGPRRAFSGAGDAESPVGGPVRSAPGQSVPEPGSSPPERDPWAPPAVPYGATRAPRFSPTPTSADGFSDTSAEVSAVAGAPTLGEPMAARASVSARRAASELPSADAVFDQTVMAARRRNAWTLTPPLGAPITVARDVLIIGRRPSADPAFPGAQLVSVADETRTMSKTHARLELHDGEWTIIDLDSTNGVVLLSTDGRETELLPLRPHVATARFLLGDAELSLAHDDA